jgi:hypothetical protein
MYALSFGKVSARVLGTKYGYSLPIVNIVVIIILLRAPPTFEFIVAPLPTMTCRQIGCSSRTVANPDGDSCTK